MSWCLVLTCAPGREAGFIVASRVSKLDGMILALEEDSVLYVYDTPAAAVEAVEGLDAEATFREVFDELAQPCSIDWVEPNRFGRKWLGFFRTCMNGSYRLVPAGGPNEAALLRAIRAAVAIDPRSAEPTVRALAERLVRHQG